MKLTIRIVLGVMSVISLAFGLAAVSAIADPLFGAFPAEVLTINLRHLTGVELRYIIIIYNSIFLVPLAVIKIKFKAFRWSMFLGTVPLIILAFPLEFFLNNIFGKIDFSSFALKVLIYVGGLLISTFSMALFQACNAFQFPSSELCEFAGEKTKWRFSWVRFLIDAITFLIGLIILWINFAAGNKYQSVGFGTIALFLFASFLIGFFLKLIKKIKFIAEFRH